MFNDTILTTAWLIQEYRHRRAKQELLIAEAVQAAGLMMTTERMASPWRTVQISQ